MMNITPLRLALVGMTLVTLAGCQSSLLDINAIRDTSNSTPSPQGKKLGGGFIEGMTPAQTCIHFYDHYKARKNNLCKKVGSSNFSELTIVNNEITMSPDKNNPVKSIAFFFDKNAALTMVQAVANPDSDDGQNKNKTTREISDAYSGVQGN